MFTNASRRENSAEHSWHLAIMSFLLAEYATEPIDVPRVTKMLLLHDVIEINTGDTFAAAITSNRKRWQGKTGAARRPSAYSICYPKSRRASCKVCREEFEEFKTAVSKYANALDHLRAAIAQRAQKEQDLAHPFRGSR